MSVVGKLFYSTTNVLYKPNIVRSSKTILFQYPGPDYNDSCPYSVTLPPGEYKIECWGGSTSNNGERVGYGGYAAGTLTLKESLSFYIYLGGSPSKQRTDFGSYNGGGRGDSPGAGATDIRLVGGAWDNLASLKSRIIVAGGAGGCDTPFSKGGGYGGGVVGTSGHADSNAGYGGTQEAGGKGFVSGSFGKGGSYQIEYEGGKRKDHGSGGGGGYYGGGTGMEKPYADGGGGSSFISGHQGCKAIDESGKPKSGNKHYSGIYFTNTKTITGGDEKMPLPTGENGVGFVGSGVVKISSDKFLDYLHCSCIMNHNQFNIVPFLLLICCRK